jgi:hypothetical protein
MAPNLAASQHDLIRDMILARSLTTADSAAVAGCSERPVKAMRHLTTRRLEQMCCDAGVKLMYLPLYSPDLNPIKGFFAELKAFIKKNWRAFEDAPEQGFDAFLEWCIDMVGNKEDSARGRFSHAGITVEEF